MESRSKKSARNIFTGFVSKMLLMAFAFATKTIFIRLLGAEYNGISGLYSNILSILSLSELGLGNVLNFSLYQALRNHDERKVRSIVQYFKKLYWAIAIGVLAIGLCLVPLLPAIVNSTLPQNEVVLYYLLYLLNSVASYFVVYKTTVISADQNAYISNICETVATFVMYVAQIAYLLLFRSFIGYLVIQVLCTIIKNMVMSCITDKKYPYLSKGEVDKDAFDKKQLVSNIKATFLYKISAVILSNTDNILISVIVGTIAVGYYSNYYMVITYIASFVSIFITGITASLGNLNAQRDANASYGMFKMLSLVFSFIATVVSCCLLNCYQAFIPIWIGKEYVMPISWVLVIVINNYLNEVMSPVWMFRETMGLFKQVQFLMPITALLNLLFSVVLGIKFGVPGILIATALSKVVSQYWYEPRILFREQFKISERSFFLSQLKQILVSIAAVLISYLLCIRLPQNVFGLVVRAVLSAAVAVLAVWMANRKSSAWMELYRRYVQRFVKKIIRKGRRHDN